MESPVATTPLSNPVLALRLTPAGQPVRGCNVAAGRLPARRVACTASDLSVAFHAALRGAMDVNVMNELTLQENRSLLLAVPSLTLHYPPGRAPAPLAALD